jgi:hypothetical protein
MIGSKIKYALLVNNKNIVKKTLKEEKETRKIKGFITPCSLTIFSLAGDKANFRSPHRS